MINKLKISYLKKIKNLRLPRDIIIDSIKRNKNKICVIENNRYYTYLEIFNRGKRLANVLFNLGLKKGDKLGILIYNSKEYFELRIACYMTGIIAVPLVHDFDINDIIYIMNDCKVKCLVYDKEIVKNNINRLKKETNINKYISVGDEYERIIEKSKDIVPYIDIEENDIASINFSSGTTGMPKGIILSQKSWMNSFYNFVLNAPKFRKEHIRYIHILSLATAGGCSFLPLMYIGSSNVFLKKYNTREAVEKIIKFNINSTFMSPSYLYLIQDYLKSNNITTGLKFIIVGTELISSEKLKQAILFFKEKIQQGYGLAEVLPPFTLSSSKDYIKNNKINLNNVFSGGKILDGINIKILNGDLKEIPKDNIGRIAIKSPSVSPGYYNNIEKTKENFKKSWFITEDYGFIKDNYLHVLGRKEDIIKINNKHVFRSQIEEILHKNPKVLNCYVFKKENRLYAAVSMKNNHSSNESELKNYMNQKNTELIPEKIILADEIPLNASGKVDRKKIEKMF